GFDITVMDSDPSNGPIIDGCGSFQYMIRSTAQSSETTNGLTGALAPGNWEVVSTTSNANQTATATFTATTLTLSTSAAVFSSGSAFGVTADLQFATAGELSFDYDFNGVDDGFDDALIVLDFEGNVVTTVLDTDAPATGSATLTIETGYTLMVELSDDGFQPFAGAFASELVLSNFSFTGGDLLGLDFETCWGIVNAEDKTPPAVVTEVEDVNLLCVDLDANTLTTLPANISKCYEVFSNNRSATASGQIGAVAGTTVAGTMAPQLRARLLAGGLTPLLPTFTDGCTDRIRVCVNDVVAYNAIDPLCEDVILTRTFTATEIAVCPTAAGEANESVTSSFRIIFNRPTLEDLDVSAV
ncbi:hypothetical protein H9S92_11220, partial [Lewinella lacunae]